MVLQKLCSLLAHPVAVQHGNSADQGFAAKQEEALEAEVRSSIVSHMVLVHQSVRTFSTKFQEQLRRHNYVTPKNYLDFIHNYKHALADNRTTFSGMAARLDGGLQKLIQACSHLTDDLALLQTCLKESQMLVNQHDGSLAWQ